MSLNLISVKKLNLCYINSDLGEQSILELPTLQVLAKSLKKPGDSVRNLENLVGYFFLSHKFKEHFK